MIIKDIRGEKGRRDEFLKEKHEKKRRMKKRKDDKK